MMDLSGKRAAAIVQFWFEGLDDSQVLHKNLATVRRWFSKNAEFDAVIRRNFEEDLTRAAMGDLHEWEKTFPGRLALILLFDQFSRNMYRDTSQMFAYDPLALGLTLRTISEKREEELSLVARIFLYMPLMHAEDLQAQKVSVICFEKLTTACRQSYPQSAAYYEYTLKFAQRHQAIVARFGRFPHRNALLGRLSTKEESDFLEQPGSSF